MPLSRSKPGGNNVKKVFSCADGITQWKENQSNPSPSASQASSHIVCLKLCWQSRKPCFKNQGLLTTWTPQRKGQKPRFAPLHFQLEQIVCVLKVMSCVRAAALIWSSLALVSNGSLEHHSREEKEQRGQCMVMSRVICQLISLQNLLPQKNSCSLQMSEPCAFSVSLFCPCVKKCNWILSCLASKATHLTSRPRACQVFEKKCNVSTPCGISFYGSSGWLVFNHWLCLWYWVCCPIPISVSLVPLMKIPFYTLQSDLKQSWGNAIKAGPAVSRSLWHTCSFDRALKKFSPPGWKEVQQV